MSDKASVKSKVDEKKGASLPGHREGERPLLEGSDPSWLLILSQRLEGEGIPARLFPPSLGPNLGGLGHRGRCWLWVPEELYGDALQLIESLNTSGVSEEEALEALALSGPPPPQIKTPGLFQRGRFLLLSFFLLIVIPFLVIYFSAPP